MSVDRVGKIVIRWVLVVLWMALIYILSAQPDLPHHSEALIDLVIKKGGHMAEYAVLAALALWAVRQASSTTSRRAFVWALLVAVVYAVSDETHQYFVPGRTPRPLDVGFDVLGACLSLLVLSRVVRTDEGPPGR